MNNLTQPLNGEISSSLIRYLEFFPDECEGFGLLQRQLAMNENVADEHNALGHVTCNVIVASASKPAVWTGRQISYGSFIDSGAHVDGLLGLWQNAQRGYRECDDLSRIAEHWWTHLHRIPLDIDSHFVATADGQRHVHHDFQYLAIFDRLDFQSPGMPAELYKNWSSLEQLRTFGGARAMRAVGKLLSIFDSGKSRAARR